MDKKKENGQFEIKIVLDDSIAQGIYVNFLRVLFNKAEFVMDFGKIVPNKADVKVQARLITNPIAFKQIVKTLIDHLKRYEDFFGVISEDMPPPPKGVIQ